MENSLSDNSTNTKRQSTMMQIKCKICGVPARHSHFGVISCDSCKMFFKRNAKHELELLKCHYDGHCEININNRRICSYCRLVKCFKSGMQVKMIRSTSSNRNRQSEKRKLIANSEKRTSQVLARLNEPAMFSTLNLLQKDQSTLSIDQWVLLSNLSHCYDEYSGLAIGERFMRGQTNLPIKIRFKSSSVLELIKVLLDETQLLYKNNRDFLSLSTDDRSILLHTTIKHIGSLSSNFIYHKINIFNYPAYYDAVGIITNQATITATKRAAERLDFDVIVLKLLLGILCFSTFKYTVYSNTSPVNLSNIKQILHIQNTYTELIWRYLVYKYNFEGAVKCLSNLVRCLFAIHDTIVNTEEIEWFADKVDTMIQKTEETLTLND
ncbi:unnamed protein product [Rotaria sordida]|uniref:Nuclear receptor domain-containing protein n=3 Tax=Rotaria sordida TaxID=392033 RepID=A0A819DLM6_9BILA|nr:unnamed protein product [Rotaria sordida]